MLAAVNGVLGDHLAASANPLAIPMRLRRDGQPLDLTTPALAAAIPQPTGKILVLAHGLCMNDLQWRRKEHDHGAALAADAGFTPVYLHYNSGLHVSTNGRAFAGQLEALLHAWPVPVDELVIIGHSMGGLVARSACHYGKLAGHAWPRHLRKIVFLGTPHHGTPLERGGNWVTVGLGVSRYTAAFARLGKIRSAGITDLRYGSLLDEDWEDRDRFAHARDIRRVRAAARRRAVLCHRRCDRDGRKRAQCAAPRRRTRALAQRARPARGPGPEPVVPGVTAVDRLRHEPLDLLDRREVYEQIRQWLAGPFLTLHADRARCLKGRCTLGRQPASAGWLCQTTDSTVAAARIGENRPRRPARS